MSHLATLSNQITFKKSFSDKVVLEAFVRDITGETFIAGKIETEKEFTPTVGRVKVKFDIFAESEDGRAVLELQRVRYDNHFDRFIHYFMTAIVEQVGSCHAYAVPRKVITIVLLTAPYTQKDLTGRLIEDSLLISDLDPRNLKGEQKTIFGHKLYYLNPRHAYDHLPPAAREWLRLVEKSMKQPEVDSNKPLGDQLGLHDPAVIRAAQLSLWDGLTADERTEFVNTGQEELAMASIHKSLDEEREAKEEALMQKEDALMQKHDALKQAEEALAEIQRLRTLLGM